MADEKVIFEVDISSLSQAVIKAQADLDAYNGALEESIAETGKWSEETVAATAAVNAQSKAVKQAEGALLRVTQAEMALGGSIKDIVKNYDASNKSVEQNRKVLNALTAEYNKLTGTARANLVPVIKNISDELKRQEGQIGDTRRNVGNYFNEFAKGVPQLGAAVSGIQNLGVAFTAAGGGVKGFGAALATTGLPLIILGVNTLIDAFKTFTPLAEAVENIMGGLSAAFTTSYSEGVKVVELKRQLEENDRNQIVTNAELKKSITELEVVAANKAAKDEDRIKALEGANKLREEQLRLQKEDAQGQLDLINLQVKQAEESANKKAGVLTALGFATRGKVNSELLKQQQEANAKLIELDEAQGVQTRENLNKIAQLRKSIAEDEKATTEKTLENKKKLADEEEKIRQKNLENDFNVSQEQERIRLEQLGKEKAEIDAILKAKKDAYDKQLEFQNKTSAEYLAKVEETAQKELAIEKQKEQDKQTLVSAGFAFVTNAISAISQAVAESQQQELENDKAANDAAHANLQNRLDAGEISKKEYNLSIAKMDREMRDKEREANRKAWETNKAIQITMAVINTAQAIMAQLSNPTPYVGIALAALAAATGAIQIGIIAAQQPPKFAKGVIGLDGAGTSTSDSIDAKLSKGESVVTAKATQRFHRELAYMEMSVGNKPNYQFGRGRFAGGFIPTISTDGGFVARQTLQSSDMTMAMQNAIRNGFALAPAPVLSIVEFQNKQDSRNRSVKVSEA